jgi:AAA family ATP:ADP antiporter
VALTALNSGPDSRAAASAVAAVTLIITFQLAGRATRDALFLSTFGVAALPPMVIVAAVLSGILSVLLARVMARSQPARLVPRLIGLSAVLSLAEWALALEARRPAAVLVYLHFTALGAILVSGFWAMVNERFDPRTARRTVGHITAGGSLGGLLGGLLPQLIGRSFSVLAMLPILAGLQLAAAVLVQGVEYGAAPSPVRPRHQSPEPVLSASKVFQASPYLSGLALLVALTAAAEGVLDYVFKARATRATSSGEELLHLFAAFYTATALLGIFIQVTSLRRVLDRLGIARSVSLLPAGVSVGAITAFLIPGLWSVLLARGAEVVLRSSFFRAAYELLFTPVAPSEKRATKLLLDVGAARVGDVAAGVLILVTLFLTGTGRGGLLLMLTLALSVAALVVTRRLQRGYVAALEGSLQRRSGDLPDPLQDDAAALLQTVGGFDLSGIRSRPIHLTTRAPMSQEVRTAATASVQQTPLDQAIKSGKSEQIQEALTRQHVPPEQIESVIELLAWDAVAPAAIRALGQVARTRPQVLLSHLLDQQQDFAIRRRLVNALAECRSPEVFEGLLQALNDRRFEVRFRAGRALSRMVGEIPGLVVERDRIVGVVLKEMAVDRSIWESRWLIDTTEDDTSPMEAEAIRDRATRSLEHLFTLLSLILPRETLRLAFHGLHTDDRQLRGTALEYLETVLPEPIWTRLRPLLEDGERPSGPRKTPNEALQELLASRSSIEARMGGRVRSER